MSLQIDGNIHVQKKCTLISKVVVLNSDNNIKSLIKQGRVELICFIFCVTT